MDRDTAKLVADDFTLTGMHTGSHLNSERFDCLDDGPSATDRTRWPIEDGEEAIARRINLPTTVALELLTHDKVVVFKQFFPSAVPDLRCAAGGADHVSEEDGCKHSVGLGSAPRAGQESLYLIADRVSVSNPQGVILARKLYVFGAWDMPGEIAAMFNFDRPIINPMRDKGRNTD
jgi:hypothetical protein